MKLAIELAEHEERAESEARLSAELQQIKADARALWAVRVLDAQALAQDLNAPPRPRRQCGLWLVAAPFRTPDDYLVEWRIFNGATPEAARLAAAQAVFPSLPAHVREKLGECP